MPLIVTYARRLLPPALFGLWALALTLPLVLHLPDHLPLGTESAPTVPLLNLWTLEWNAQQLAAGYPEYWDAPIFYPERGALALADPQPLTGILYALFRTSANNIPAYNLTLLTFLALNGWAGWRLAGTLGAAEIPALLAGLIAESLPFVSNELGVLQLIPVFPVFGALHALLRFGQRARLRDAIAIGGWTGATFLLSGYYGLFLIPIMILGAIIFTRRRHLTARGMAAFLGACVTLGLILIPVIPAQLRHLAGYTRSERTIEANSAWLDDYLRLDPRAWGGEAVPWLSPGWRGQRLYPGTGVLILGMAGAALGWRSNRGWIIFTVLGTALAVLISLGLRLQIFELQPYQFLRTEIPGYAQLRSPFRMAVCAQVFLASLCAFTLHALWQWRGWFGRAGALTITLLSLTEIAALPRQLYPAAGILEPPGWVTWLAEQPYAPAVMLPFESGGSVQDFEPVSLGMVFSLEHGKPLLNGYSGFFPDSYHALKAAAGHFPNEHSLSALAERAPVYLIIETGWLTAPRRAALDSLAGNFQIMELYSDETKTIHWLESP
jgi:hypothetical protein